MRGRRGFFGMFGPSYFNATPASRWTRLLHRLQCGGLPGWPDLESGEQQCTLCEFRYRVPPPAVIRRSQRA